MTSPKQSIALALLDNLLTSIIVVDSKMVVHYLNNAAQQMLGLSLRQANNQHISQLFDTSGLDLNRITKLTQRDPGFSEREVSISIGNVDILVDFSAIAVQCGRKTFFIFEIRTIDQQKKISDETHQYAQQVASRELIRNLAHEIKNPLGGIRGAAQLLSKDLPNSLQEYTNIIIKEADRLKGLVDRLLGPQKVAVYDLHNIHEILEHVRKLMLIAAGDKLQIKQDYDPSIPELLMDYNQMYQVILNITKNASEALNGSGVITFSTRAVFKVNIHGKRHRVACEIKITDNGPGIDPSIMDTVFYPMVTTKVQGNGLGLAIAQTIIDQHKGKLECKSKPGATSFIITLPITNTHNNIGV